VVVVQMGIHARALAPCLLKKHAYAHTHTHTHTSTQKEKSHLRTLSPHRDATHWPALARGRGYARTDVDVCETLQTDVSATSMSQEGRALHGIAAEGRAGHEHGFGARRRSAGVGGV
jgi:hypothetical protein